MDTTFRDNQAQNTWLDTYHSALGQLASRRMGEAVEQGSWIGRVPIGYIMRYNGSKQIEVDKNTAELVRLAFGLAASRTLSLRDVLAKVTALGLTGHNGRRIGLSSLHHLLTNPFYTGMIRYKGNLYKGNQTPIVTRELFQQVQENLTARRCS